MGNATAPAKPAEQGDARLLDDADRVKAGRDTRIARAFRHDLAGSPHADRAWKAAARWERVFLRSLADRALQPETAA
jgi:hypothetical protein